jgi:hypothetical protein
MVQSSSRPGSLTRVYTPTVRVCFLGGGGGVELCAWKFSLRHIVPGPQIPLVRAGNGPADWWEGIDRRAAQ